MVDTELLEQLKIPSEMEVAPLKLSPLHCLLEVAIGCTVNCRAGAIIYRVLEFRAIIN